MEDNIPVIDMRKLFLNKSYSVSYGPIAFDVKWESKTRKALVVKRGQCDLINMLDLVLPIQDHQSNSKIENSIDSIAVEFGGHRFDCAASTTQLVTTNSLHDRYWHRVNNMFFLPLALAPLHKHNLVPPSTTYHDLVIIIDFKQVPESFEIYGMRYFIHEKHLLADSTSYLAYTHQQQYWGGEQIVKGVNRIQLNLNHHIRFIYFWGIDTTKVTSVSLVFDGHLFYKGTIEAMEHAKALFGYPDVDAPMIVFSFDEMDVYPNSAINFNEYDKAMLELETSEEAATLHIVGVNINTMLMSCGMIGLKNA